MGPKLKEMEEAGRSGATEEFQDLFVEVATTVDGVTEDGSGGYAFGGLYQMLVMGKAV